MDWEKARRELPLLLVAAFFCVAAGVRAWGKGMDTWAVSAGAIGVFLLGMWACVEVNQWWADMPVRRQRAKKKAAEMEAQMQEDEGEGERPNL